MNKCLRITLGKTVPEGFLRSFVQRHARKLDLEGAAQVTATDGEVRIDVCGPKDALESFLDLLHKGTAAYRPKEITVEPFLKEKDYRGVFRVIE